MRKRGRGRFVFRLALRRSARKFPLDREFHETDQVVDVQLPHQAGAIGVDGFGADIEQIGDILSTQSVDEV